MNGREARCVDVDSVESKGLRVSTCQQVISANQYSILW